MITTSPRRNAFAYASKLCAAYALLALFLAAPALSYQLRSTLTTPAAPVVVSSQPSIAEKSLGKPVSVQFAWNQKSLQVSEGKYDPALTSWTVAEHEVQWIKTGDKLINGKPTTHAIYYGHATEAVLGTTRDVKVGDKLIITTENGTQLVYAYASDETVLPTNLAVLSEKDSQRLTLITCKGFNNEYRRLMKFQFVGVAS